MEQVAQSSPSQATESALSAIRPVRRKAVRQGTVEPARRTLLRTWLNPAAVVATLTICMLAFRAPFSSAYAGVAVLALLISRQVFSPLSLRTSSVDAPDQVVPSRRLLEWGVVVLLLMLLGKALGLDRAFSRGLIVAWFALTPVALWLVDFYRVRLVDRHSSSKRHLIIGANEVGTELAKRIGKSAFIGRFMGYFDFRGPDRLSEETRKHFAGNCEDLAAFVRRHSVNEIYIALPIANGPRIEKLLHELRQTTASIYWVPDIFAFDLIQPRCVDIDGMPVISICDTPFQGMKAVQKRTMDIVLASLAILLTWPVMLVIAAAIKLTSAGPVFFRQRRHGLNGEEIVVYKFRSMTVCEDGGSVPQAVKQDPRITPIGGLLRRTSLDELPQLFNVLEGKMSLVGPRPHAVAHNEQYRSLISGYMIRHKVRPGITGWAQIKGQRGETETLDKMRRRIEHDLEYLENWSMWLDLQIIAKTIFTVLTDKSAY